MSGPRDGKERDHGSSCGFGRRHRVGLDALDDLSDQTGLRGLFLILALLGSNQPPSVIEAAPGVRPTVYAARPRTRVPLLSARRRSRLTSVRRPRHIAVTVAWSIYKRIFAAHSHPDRRRGKTMIGHGHGIPCVRRKWEAPAGQDMELALDGQRGTLQRPETTPTWLPDTSRTTDNRRNGTTEAINGRPEASTRATPRHVRNLAHRT